MKPVRILHLEDSAIDAELICGFLEKAGVQFDCERQWTRDGFVEALQDRHFDLIIADYVLPAFDGLAALEIAREASPETPFIFLSGTLGEDIAVESLKRGATDYVVKQRLDRLPAVVERALAESSERRARQAAEDRLGKSEELHRLIIDSARDFAIVALDGDGAITSWNDGAELLLGYLDEEVLGRSGDIFFTPEDRQAGEPDREMETARTSGRAENERWHVRKDGSRFWGSGLMQPLAEGRGFVKIFQDRTREHRALVQLTGLNEQLTARVDAAVLERQAAVAQLHEVQKLETLGQLTGGVAHDFNNLLTPIVGGLDMLRRKHSDDPRSARMIGGALQAAERARTLVSRLLAFSRRQQLHPQVVSLPALIAGMHDLVSRSLGPQIELEIKVPGALPAIRVDPNQLELAVLNLCVNARDAMSGGGRLTIAADAVENSSQSELAPGPYVRLCVTDSGCGMDPTTVSRAIEPFFSTKGVGKGTGLGLSMVHGLAAQSGGALKLKSSPGQGTTATIYLPALAEVAAPIGERVHDEPVAIRPLQILLVDDEELVRLGTADLLEELGHSVTQAASGIEALDRLARDNLPDLLITDYMMPGLTGAELIREARRNRPSLPALIVTGYAKQDACKTLDVQQLAKPFSAAELASAMLSAISDGKVVSLLHRS